MSHISLPPKNRRTTPVYSHVAQRPSLVASMRQIGAAFGAIVTALSAFGQGFSDETRNMKRQGGIRVHCQYCGFDTGPRVYLSYRRCPMCGASIKSSNGEVIGDGK